MRSLCSPVFGRYVILNEVKDLFSQRQNHPASETFPRLGKQIPRSARNDIRLQPPRTLLLSRHSRSFAPSRFYASPHPTIRTMHEQAAQLLSPVTCYLFPVCETNTVRFRLDFLLALCLRVLFEYYPSTICLLFPPRNSALSPHSSASNPKSAF